MTLVSLTCAFFDYPNPPGAPPDWPPPAAFLPGSQEKTTAPVPSGETIQVHPTVVVDQPSAGGCYWHNDEITPPAGSTSNPNMEIDVSVPMEIKTTLKQGVSGCQDQYFSTHHRWAFFDVMCPGKPQRLEVVFE